MVAAGTTACDFDNLAVVKSENETSLPPEILEAELDTRNELLNLTSMVTITDLQGTIIYVNDLFCKVSGYNRHHVIGRTHELIRHSDLNDMTIANIWRSLRNGQTWQGIIKSRRVDDSIFWSQTTVAPVTDETGEPVRYVWVRQDITDLKQAEHDLFIAKQRADQQLLDNVKNAHRIQNALLPCENELRSVFPSSFLLFTPQHSISGDLYWMSSFQDESVVVLGDGTGHGVSASFVSLMALTCLKYAVEDMRLTEPGAVLTHLNAFMYRAMNKHKGSGLSESVDLAFCRFNHKTRHLSYASGKSRTYLISKGTITELERGEVSIGSAPEEESKFQTQEIDLEPGDRIFMMSDGLADQFGGDRNKRMGSRHVRELLLLTCRLPMHEQKEIIRQNFLLWKGTNEQTDDLSVIAFQVE